MWVGGLPRLADVTKEQVGFIRLSGPAACLCLRGSPPVVSYPPMLISGMLWVSVGSADARGNVPSVEGPIGSIQIKLILGFTFSVCEL